MVRLSKFLLALLDHLPRGDHLPNIQPRAADDGTPPGNAIDEGNSRHAPHAHCFLEQIDHTAGPFLYAAVREFSPEILFQWLRQSNCSGTGHDSMVAYVVCSCIQT